MPDRYSPEDPREWLNRAHSNLAIAKNRTDTSVYPEDLCFNAQQAAEKALKAVCISHHIEYPYVHDLAALITVLMKNGSSCRMPSKNPQNSRVLRSQPVIRISFHLLKRRNTSVQLQRRRRL